MAAVEAAAAVRGPATAEVDRAESGLRLRALSSMRSRRGASPGSAEAEPAAVHERGGGDTSGAAARRSDSTAPEAAEFAEVAEVAKWTSADTMAVSPAVAERATDDAPELPAQEEAGGFACAAHAAREEPTEACGVAGDTRTSANFASGLQERMAVDGAEMLPRELSAEMLLQLLRQPQPAVLSWLCAQRQRLGAELGAEGSQWVQSAEPVRSSSQPGDEVTLAIAP